MTDKTQERALEAALFRLYEHWWKDLGYRAERFRQTIDPKAKRYKGGVRAATDVVLKNTSGFERLRGHPELTIEYRVASGEWGHPGQCVSVQISGPASPLFVVGPRELESLTSCVSSRRSNQLSYGPVCSASIARCPKALRSAAEFSQLAG